jgi:hypothetical protein
MSFHCPVYELRNNKESLYIENHKIGKLKLVEINQQTLTKDLVARNIEEECKNKLPICFETSCTNPRCQNICIVYSNKKTGSMSLFSSLCIYFSNTHLIFHFHNNSDLLVYNIETVSVSDLCSHLNDKRKNVTVIEIYRPILDLCISNFFFGIELYCRPMDESELLDDYVNYIIKVFNDLFLYLIHVCNTNKLLTDYGINIKDHKINSAVFAAKKDYTTYILIRLKDSDKWPELLKEFLPNGDFQIHRENDTENKCLGEIYKLFKANYKLPKNFFEIIQLNDQFINFYTEEERNEYLTTWETKLDNNDYTPFTKEEAKSYIKNKREVYSEDLKTIRTNIMNHNKSTEGNCVCDECIQEREATIAFYNLLQNDVINFEFEMESTEENNQELKS